MGRVKDIRRETGECVSMNGYHPDLNVEPGVTRSLRLGKQPTEPIA